MFGTKNKVKPTPTPLETKQKIHLPTQKQIYDEPKICCFDVSKKIINCLQSMHFHVFEGSLGKIVKLQSIQSRGYCCLPNYISPKNAHEYDIFIFDMSESEATEFIPEEHQRKHIPTKDNFYLYCNYPQNVFDPRAYSGNYLRSEIQYYLKKKRLVIVFADEHHEHKYSLVNKRSDYVDNRGVETISNYAFLPHEIPFKSNKIGKKIKVSTKNQTLSSILTKFLQQMEYQITFVHPSFWFGGKEEKDKKFFPVLVNDVDEIVSYGKFDENVFTIILPFMENKDLLLKELFVNFFPDIAPELFPNDEKKLWKNKEEYFLPNHKQLIEEETSIKIKYDEELNAIKNKIEANANEYKFLHQLLTATGDELVNVTIEYLNFLGFTQIKNMDETQSKKEEDIQVTLPDSLLIIEVKGIGGTSSDNECAQISKIRARRCEERNKFDVSALYLVNHQRHIPPLERKNPPFSEDQIKDAELNNRGLLTTWLLFKLYFYINSGIITKEHARKCMVKKGLITFTPDRLKYIGKVEEVFKNGLVAIITLENETISKNDTFYHFCDDRYVNIVIVSIQVDSKDVGKATNCEVGLKVNKKMQVGDLLYKIV